MLNSTNTNWHCLLFGVSRLVSCLLIQVVLPKMGGYWLDDGSDTTASGPADPSQTASCKLELDETARCYRRFFVGKVSTAHLLPPTHLFSYHLSFTPVVLNKNSLHLSSVAINCAQSWSPPSSSVL